jgi:hypothetical protein
MLDRTDDVEDLVINEYCHFDKRSPETYAIDVVSVESMSLT